MTMTFDSWEVLIHPPEDCLEHHGIRGMKHGRRRYQNEDGTWTEVGLEERRKREGFGESKAERKAEKRVRQAEKRLQKSERVKARKEARERRKAERAEARRKRSISGLTDEEMKTKLARARMEAEYRDLTKRKSLVDTGASLISKYLEYKDKQAQRTIDINRQKVDLERVKADIIKSKETRKKAHEEFKTAREDRYSMEANVKGGLKKERKAKLIDAKREMKNYTVRGGIAKRINMWLTSGKAKEYESIRKAKGEIKVNTLKSDGARDLKKRRQQQAQKDLAPEKKRSEQLRREREKARKEFERRMKRISNF